MQINVFIPVYCYFFAGFLNVFTLCPHWIPIVVFVFRYLFFASVFPQILTSPLWFTISWSATNTSVTPGSVSITTITETSNFARRRTSFNSEGKDVGADGHTHTHTHGNGTKLKMISFYRYPVTLFLSALSLTRTCTPNVHHSTFINMPYLW